MAQMGSTSRVLEGMEDFDGFSWMVKFRVTMPVMTFETI